MRFNSLCIFSWLILKASLCYDQERQDALGTQFYLRISLPFIKNFVFCLFYFSIPRRHLFTSISLKMHKPETQLKLTQFIVFIFSIVW